MPEIQGIVEHLVFVFCFVFCIVDFVVLFFSFSTIKVSQGLKPLTPSFTNWNETEQGRQSSQWAHVTSLAPFFILSPLGPVPTSSVSKEPEPLPHDTPTQHLDPNTLVLSKAALPS